jgi:hypothetical protein
LGEETITGNLNRRQHRKQTQQLELLIDAAIQSKTRTPEELLAYVIDLYGKEFIKANDEIARLRSANDELFKIKQKVVIANRELIGKNKTMFDHVILIVKAEIDNCDHPQCVEDRARTGFSQCAGGHIARRLCARLDDIRKEIEQLRAPPDENLGRDKTRRTA